MIYYIYKITNLLNNKIYIGIHKSASLKDSYMGSGKLIKAAIKKYGIDNFRKDVIEVFNSEDEMICREQEIVTEEFIKNEDNYNIMPGGKFGSKERNGLTFTGKHHSADTIEKIRLAAIGRKHTAESRQKMSDNNFSVRDPGRHKKVTSAAGSYAKSDEHRLKISNSLKGSVTTGNGGRKNKGKVREQLQCPYCTKSGAKNVMLQWHFDKCKHIGDKSIGADPTL